MIRIALCDGDEDFLSYIENLMQKQLSGENIQIEKYSSPHTVIDLASKGSFFDIIVAETVFEDTNGIEMAKTVRKYDSEAIIIFLTQDDAYCIDSYKVGAMNYILKPIDESYFIDVMRSGTERVRKNCYVYLPLNYGAIRKKSNDIEYICVYDKSVEYHLSDGTEEHYTGSLRSVEGSLLNIACFYKALRSIIINMDHVEYVKKGEVRMRSGFCFAVSRKKSKMMTDHILSYFNKV